MLVKILQFILANIILAIIVVIGLLKKNIDIKYIIDTLKHEVELQWLIPYLIVMIFLLFILTFKNKKLNHTIVVLSHELSGMFFILSALLLATIIAVMVKPDNFSDINISELWIVAVGYCTFLIYCIFTSLFHDILSSIDNLDKLKFTIVYFYGLSISYYIDQYHDPGNHRLLSMSYLFVITLPMAYLYNKLFYSDKAQST